MVTRGKVVAFRITKHDLEKIDAVKSYFKNWKLSRSQAIRLLIKVGCEQALYATNGDLVDAKFAVTRRTKKPQEKRA